MTLTEALNKLHFFARQLAHLLVFSSVYMGIGAVSMTLLTFELLNNQEYPVAYIWFVFCSAVFLYCLHRVIGIKKVSAFADQGRFTIIKQYQKHIWFYGVIGLIGASISFLLLPPPIQVLLVIPAIISLAYVLPFLPNKKRLRDLPFVKLFLIGLVWGWITSAIPNAISIGHFDDQLALSFAERVFFFISAALPFDIRDKKVDEVSLVKTMPTIFGVGKSKWFAWICLAVHFTLVMILNNQGYFAYNVFLPYLLYFFCCTAFIYFSSTKREHLYFTVFLDGTLIILPVLVWVIVLS